MTNDTTAQATVLTEEQLEAIANDWRWHVDHDPNNTIPTWLLLAMPQLITSHRALTEQVRVLAEQNIWAAQFTCPVCGPCTFAMVTTKKTCLSCGSSLQREQHPVYKQMRVLQEALESIVIEAAPTDHAAVYTILDEYIDRARSALAALEGEVGE